MNYNTLVEDSNWTTLATQASDGLSWHTYHEWYIAVWRFSLIPYKFSTQCTGVLVNQLLWIGTNQIKASNIKITMQEIC